MKHVPAGPCIDGATRDNPPILERPRDEFNIFRCQRSSQPFVFLGCWDSPGRVAAHLSVPEALPIVSGGASVCMGHLGNLTDPLQSRHSS
jgi:hypothetical protein